MKKLRALAVFLISILFINCMPVQSNATSLMDELFGISFYRFHYMEKSREYEKTEYDWGSDIGAGNGVSITKTGLNTIRIEIDADGSELYQTTKPALMWVHKGDSLFDVTKYTDIEQWYRNKLAETYLIQKLDQTGEDTVVEISVPLSMNIGQYGLIEGGYYEIEFYSADTIPKQLQFAYESQSYSLEDLEAYIQADMSDNIGDYYNVDSGFRPDTDGLPYFNTGFVDDKGEIGGMCAGISCITTAKYNGYTLPTKVGNILVPESCSWYDNVFGSASINDIRFDNMAFADNYPSLHLNEDGTAAMFPLRPYSNGDNDNNLLGLYLEHYNQLTNAVVRVLGNQYVGQIAMTNLENRWTIIDNVANQLRQGKAVTVNLVKAGGGGHAIVGYKMEQIDDDTYRLYCYDSNAPDGFVQHSVGSEINRETNEDGSYKYIICKQEDMYIDITRTVKRAFVDKNTYKEIDVFEFDSHGTTCKTSTAEGGLVTFTMCTGEDVRLLGYGNETNEVIAYKAYPVIKSDNTVELRTFAFYQSGEAREITNSKYTTVKMDYNFIGQYKVKDSKITLTKSGCKFAEEGNSYIDAYVTYDDNNWGYGQIKVRIPVIAE